MVGVAGGIFNMIHLKNYLPDKLFGKDTGIIVVWVTPVLIIVALILVTFSVVWPRVTEIETNFANIEKVTKNISLLNEKRLYLLSLDQADLQSKSMLVENGVLSEKNSYLLVKIISKIATDFEYTIGDFSVTLGDVSQVEKKSAKFDYQKVPVEVILNGPKAKFLDLVSGIEKSLPVLSIDNFSMSSNQNDVAVIKMSISAYYLPDWNQTKLESLSVTDLTPSKDESKVLTQIGAYKYYGASEAELGKTKENFVPLNRADPFY